MVRRGTIAGLAGLAGLVGLVALAGCVIEPPVRSATPDRYTKLNASPRPLRMRTIDSVALYRNRQPEAAYVEVAEFADIDANENDALERLKASAALVGCDGLIIGTARVEKVAFQQVDSLNLMGTCIMFVDDPGTWQASVGAPVVPAPAQPPSPPEPPVDPKLVAACQESWDKVYATKTPQERALAARALPPECRRVHAPQR